MNRNKQWKYVTLARNASLNLWHLERVLKNKLKFVRTQAVSGHPWYGTAAALHSVTKGKSWNGI